MVPSLQVMVWPLTVHVPCDVTIGDWQAATLQASRMALHDRQAGARVKSIHIRTVQVKWQGDFLPG
jgi:hypothetical protein